MADNNMQIIIQAENQTESGFNDMQSALDSLQNVVEELTNVFKNFADTISNTMKEASTSIEELTSPIETTAEELSSAFGDSAKQAEEQLGQIGEGLNGVGGEAAKVADSIAADLADAATQSEKVFTNDMNTAFDDIAKKAADTSEQVAKDFLGASGNSQNSENSSNSSNSSMQGMGLMMAGMQIEQMTKPIEEAMKSAIGAFSDFDQAVANVNSMMGETPDKVQAIKDQLIQLSKTVPEGPTALANALYGVVGAGVPAKDAMDVLTTSAKAATAGQTDLGTATSALIAVMDSYGTDASQVGKIADEMFAANAAGAMTFDQFAKSIGTVAGPAAQVGVSFDQVAAATAALTNQGLSAQRATMGLRALLMGIAAPTATASKEAANLGIQWNAAELQSKGLVGMLQEAMEATGGNAEELKKLIPNIAAWTVATDLGGKGAQSYKQAMDTMAQSAGATGRALTAQEAGFAEQTEKMNAAIETARITFVQSFAPAITAVVQKVTEISQAFANLSPSTKEFIAIFATIAIAVGAVVGPILSFIATLSMIAAAFEGVTAGMLIGWSVIGVAVIAAIALIVANWQPISAFFTNLWNSILSTFSGAWNAIKNVITEAWNYISPTIKNGLNDIKSFWNSVWNDIRQIFDDVWTVMKMFLTPILDAMRLIITTDLDFIKGSWNDTWNLIKDTFKTIWDLMTDILKTAWDALTGIIKTALDLVAGIFNIFKDTFTGNWSNLWNDIKDMFSNIWNDIKGIFEDTAKDIGDIFSDLAKDALNWGKDLISGFINGIEGAMGGLINTVKSVASTVASYLHFSVPDVGPLTDYESWMPDFINGLTAGIESNKSTLLNAVSNLATGISMPFSVMSSPISSNLGLATSGYSGGGGGITIGTINVTGNIARNERELGQIVSKEIWNQIKSQGKF